MNRIAIAMLAVFVAGCSLSSEEVAPIYISPVQYSDYDCDQTRNEMRRVSAQVNKLAAKLDEDAETDEGVTAAGIILFWPALFFLGGTKGQEAEYARLSGEYNALEQSAIQKKCDLPESKTLTSSRSEGSSIEASKSTAAVDTSRRLLSDWRLRSDIVREALAKEHQELRDGGWVLSKFKIVSAVADENDPKLVTLATEYTLEPNPGIGASRYGGGVEPVTYRRSIVVDDDKEEVVQIGDAP